MAIVDNPVAYKIKGLLDKIYSTLGYGYLEDVYKAAMEVEFRRHNIAYAREAYIRVSYDGVVLPGYYKADFVCGTGLIIEVKALSRLNGKHAAQTLNYIKATNAPAGLLVNFGHETYLQYNYFVNKFSPTEPMRRIEKCEARFVPDERRSGNGDENVTDENITDITDGLA